MSVKRKAPVPEGRLAILLQRRCPMAARRIRYPGIIAYHLSHSTQPRQLGKVRPDRSMRPGYPCILRRSLGLGGVSEREVGSGRRVKAQHPFARTPRANPPGCGVRVSFTFLPAIVMVCLRCCIEYSLPCARRTVG